MRGLLRSGGEAGVNYHGLTKAEWWRRYDRIVGIDAESVRAMIAGDRYCHDLALQLRKQQEHKDERTEVV